jgi:hypothetical protein
LTLIPWKVREKEKGAKGILYLSNDLTSGSGFGADKSIVLSNGKFVTDVS